MTQRWLGRFDENSRNVFKEVLRMDEETWNRARGWALWKALITYDANRDSNEKVAEESYRIIQVLVDDYERYRKAYFKIGFSYD